MIRFRPLPAALNLWGTGKPFHEFLHVDDLANACVFIMKLKEESFRSLLTAYRSPLINIGWGKDISIRELALLVKEVVGFEGNITFDTTKPDGTPQKSLNVSKLNNVGWQSQISLKVEINQTYNWYLEHKADQDFDPS